MKNALRLAFLLGVGGSLWLLYADNGVSQLSVVAEAIAEEARPRSTESLPPIPPAGPLSGGRAVSESGLYVTYDLNLLNVAVVVRGGKIVVDHR